MLSSHLNLCHPLLLLSPIPPSIRVFFSESAFHMRWPKYWSFSTNLTNSKVMLKILQARLLQYMNHEFPDVQVDLEKAEEPEITLPTSTGSSKRQESSRRTSTSALLTMPKPWTVWITTNWKIPQKMGIPHHLTCLEKYVGRSRSNS